MKMEKNWTELVFVLDRSGSMANMAADAMGGYNAMLDKQRAESGEALVTAALFDDRYDLVCLRTPIAMAAPLTSRVYFPRGTTALYDAIGRTIERVAGDQARMKPEDRPSRTVFAVTTDGMENASHVYTRARVREMIRLEREEFGWEFLFLGANIDAAEAAGDLGIAPERAVDFVDDSEGVLSSFRAVSEAVSALRAGQDLCETAWRESVDEDYQERGRR